MDEEAPPQDEKPTLRDAIYCLYVLKRFVENEAPTPAVDILQRVDDIIEFFHKRIDNVRQQQDTHAAAAAAIEAAAEQEAIATATAAAAAAARAEAEAASNGSK
jgi:hypothetical protein